MSTHKICNITHQVLLLHAVDVRSDNGEVLHTLRRGRVRNINRSLAKRNQNLDDEKISKNFPKLCSTRFKYRCLSYLKDSESFEVKSQKGKSKTVPNKRDRSYNQRQIPYMPYISLLLYGELPALTGAPV